MLQSVPPHTEIVHVSLFKGSNFYDNVNWYIIIVNVTGFYAIGVT